ncbi:AsmA protein [Filomicrobium insigne]|uniref:AsmA protein n=1 Tax=Filomicrobium insigne TaxID=418854 RepID=A0A1H0HWT5_9HYPH|nr:AsmA family protein [Filomicrobium insigne]SDO23636.1 AsmA protein [Filomicrobium insigne]
MTNRNPPPSFQDYRPSYEQDGQTRRRPPAPGAGPSRRSPQRQRRAHQRSSGGFGTILVFVLVAVVAVIAAGLAFVVIAPPTDLIRSQLVAQVKQKTGRDLTIAGPASFKIFPALGVSLGDVSLGAPPQMGGEPLVTMDSLDVRVKLLPLLSGKIAVDTLVLTNPVFALRVDENGAKSWEFASQERLRPVQLAQASTRTTSDAPSLVPDSARGFLTGASPSEAAPISMSEIELGEVRIDNGTIHFADARTGARDQVEQINVALGLTSLADPLQLRGDFAWKGEKVATTATLTSLDAILRDAPADLKATVEAATVLAGYDGSIAFSDALALDGATILEAKSLRELAAWLGTALPQSSGYGPLSLQGRLKVAGNSISLLNSKSTLDGSEIAGDIVVTKRPGRPHIKANLKLAELDLNKYIGSPQSPSAIKVRPASTQTTKGNSPQSIEDLLREPGPRVKGYTKRKGWSSEPIDLTLLSAADADLALSVDRLLFQGLKAGRSQLAVALQDGTMQADLQEAVLYEGTARGVITLNAANPTLGFNANIVADGVSGQPLLTDAADIDWLAGRGNLSLAIASQGGSEREIVEGLSGTADFRFTDGALVGFNLAQAIRGLTQGRVSDFNRVPTQKTDFSNLSATFKIKAGVAESDDLNMASPLLRLTGAGKIMLPSREVDFTLRPKLVANLTGQGGQTGLAGIEVPVRVHGPFDNLNYTPDLGDVLKDPDKAADAIKKVGEQFKGKSAQEIIDGFVTEDETGKKKIDTKKLLNGLFGGQ